MFLPLLCASVHVLVISSSSVKKNYHFTMDCLAVKEELSPNKVSILQLIYFLRLEFGPISNQKWQNQRMKYGNQSTLILLIWLCYIGKTALCCSYTLGLFIYVSVSFFLLPDGTDTYILGFFLLDVKNGQKRSVRE